MKKNNIFKMAISLVVMLFVTTVAMAQNQTVKGTVLDENGEPVIGASVLVAGSKSNGTVTDIDGNYTLVAPKGAKVKISYIGYNTQTVNAGGIVKLVPSDASLNEVVVVGYGTQKKAHLTGAVATVPMDEIADLSNGGLASSLSGLVNGVSVSGGESRPGDNAKIYIRDVNSLGDVGSQAQEPLYVIDGYVYPNDVKIGNTTENLGATAFNNLDASVIESISVLKDAAAAVYGARAANGVILVTTKKGKLGAPKISYSGSIGWADEVSRTKMLDAYEYGRLYNAVTAADPKSTSLNNKTDIFQADELNAMRGLNYDYLDENWKTAITHKHSVNLSGASEKASYFAGISYFKQDGNLGKLDYDRWNYRAGVDLKVGKGFKFNLSISGDYGKKDKPNVKLGGTSSENDYNILLRRPRYIPETVNGRYVAAYGPSNSEADASQDYIFSLMQNHGDYSQTKSQNMNISGGIDYDFGTLTKVLNGLTARLTYSKTISNDKTNQYASDFTIYSMSERFGSGNHLYTPVGGEDLSEYYADSNFSAITKNNSSGGSGNSYLNRTMNRTDNYQLNFTLNYARDFGKHHVGALFSIEKSEAESEYLLGEVTDPYEFTTGQSNSVKSTSDQHTTFTRSESGSLSYIGRVNYAYQNKYLFEFLFRADSSTKFAPENMWGYFPSLSAGWVISEESWMQNVKWIDYLKIRASWGLTGRDNTAAWQWMKVYNTDNDKGPVFGTGLDETAGSHITINKNTAAVNRDVHWDKSYKTNVGIDFHTLNSRLALTIDGYYERNRDMLMAMDVSVPGIVGTQSAAINAGSMDNYGVEVSINWHDKIGKDFKYKVGLNTGYSDNKVYNMDWKTENLYRQITYGNRADVGVWGMQCIGMFRTYQQIDEFWEQLSENAAQSGKSPSYMGFKSKDQIKPGMLIYKDVRGDQQADGSYKGPDGVVDANLDQVQISKRSSNPYGFTVNLSAEYKRVSLTAQFSANWGAYSVVPSSALKSENLQYQSMPSFYNVSDMFSYQDVKDASGNVVVEANTNAWLPNLAYSSINSIASTYWKISAARVRLSRLTLAYSIPQSWCKVVGIESCRLNVTGQNLLSLYNPYPDHFMDAMNSFDAYPTLRKITLGLNVSF